MTGTLVDNYLVHDAEDGFQVYDADMRIVAEFADEEEATIDATQRAIDEAACELAEAVKASGDLATLKRVLTMLNRAAELVEG